MAAPGACLCAQPTLSQEALIFARPISSLADAAALATVAFRVANYLDSIVVTADNDAQIRCLSVALACLSMLLTEAAELPSNALASDPYGVAYIARHATSGEPRA